MNARPSFRPVPCHGGWQILVTWPDARTEQLSGYSSEAEAVKWINNVSERWADKALAGKKDRRQRAGNFWFTDIRSGWGAFLGR
jgi:hypothetical protein